MAPPSTRRQRPLSPRSLSGRPIHPGLYYHSFAPYCEAIISLPMANIILLSLLLSACAGLPEGIEPVSDFELDGYI